MKSIVLLVAVVVVSGFAQGGDYQAFLVLGGAANSGFTTPSGAKTPDGRESFKLRGHKKSASTGGVGINFDQPAPTSVSQQSADTRDKNLQGVNKGNSGPKDFRQNSAWKSECDGCFLPVTIGVLFLCEKLVLLGIL